MSLVFYKCSVCGNVAVKPYDSGVGLVCCGEEMQMLVPGTVDAALEKHVPDVTVEGPIISVQVGSVEHPMTEEHSIAFIALETEKGYQIAPLTPDMTPHATFAVAPGDRAVRVYEYCNLHGLWSFDL